MNEIKFQWPKGFKADAIHAGFKKSDQLDFCWIVSDSICSAAGVYTKNQFPAAPVQVTKHQINAGHQLKALVINSGNANSFTGDQGIKNSQNEVKAVANKLKIDSNLVGVASTGIIGKQLQMDKFQSGLDNLTLSESLKVPDAIITTDTTTKKICVSLEIGNKPVIITGFAKGSGMIHPNMGTTLGFILTDAKIAKNTLQKLLSSKIVSSFNQITVDGCMSTNDMVIALANGAAQNNELTEDSSEFEQFSHAFTFVITEMAKMVAKDGEGASKFIEATVKNAQSQADANQVAKAIVGSNLIKAMINGEDANWGRIVQAIGQTDAQIDPDNLAISIQNIEIIKHSKLQSIDLQQVRKALKNHNIEITVDLNTGNYDGIAWGCDLTYKYVEINSAYEE